MEYQFKRYLVSFSKITSHDGVKVSYYTDVPGVGFHYTDTMLSDTDLVQHALTNSKSTWDETDICEMLLLEDIN
jgi:hypothetical protein